MDGSPELNVPKFLLQEGRQYLRIVGETPFQYRAATAHSEGQTCITLESVSPYFQF